MKKSSSNKLKSFEKTIKNKETRTKNPKNRMMYFEQIFKHSYIHLCCEKLIINNNRYFNPQFYKIYG